MAGKLFVRFSIENLLQLRSCKFRMIMDLIVTTSPSKPGTAVEASYKQCKEGLMAMSGIQLGPHEFIPAH